MRIRLTPEADQKIKLYIKHATGEISGLGRATLSPDKSELVITDAFIWEQTATGTTTEVVDHNSVFSLAVDLEKQGIPVDELCVWWHSHADMSVFFSGTDRQTIIEWVNNRFLCALVGNKKGEYKATIAIKEPIACDIDDVPVVIGSEVDPVLDEQIKAEVENKVKHEVLKDYSTAQFQSNYNFNNFSYPVNEKAEKDYQLLVDCMCSVCLDELNETQYGTIKDPVFDTKSHELDKITKLWQPLYE
jgi:proteasome lid subunit RPN8/RPN11